MGAANVDNMGLGRLAVDNNLQEYGRYKRHDV